MINVSDHVFHLKTNQTSYVFYVNDLLQLENLYYGRRVNQVSIDTYKKKHLLPIGDEVTNGLNYSLNNLNLEYSTLGRGDFKEPSFLIEFDDGSSICDFKYDHYEIRKTSFNGLPKILVEESLVVVLKDSVREVSIELIYTVLEDTDVITRFVRVINESEVSIKIRKLMSFNLDLNLKQGDFISFHGKWIKERQVVRTPIDYGKREIKSYRGTSSANENPAFIICDRDTNEEYGNCYGFNLMYSGNHIGSVLKTTDDITRIQSGINPVNFTWELLPNEQIESPSAVLTFSHLGLNGLSKNLHQFTNQYLIPKTWRGKERPIVFNTWEAMYFDFNESKLLKFAKAGKKLGMECMVLDDGWFKGRNDDHTSLGDWYADEKKLPGGLKQLAKKIHDMNLQFGLWFEPEMISRNSDLYKNHPEWAISHPSYEALEGRNQLVLNLGNSNVVDYLEERISSIIIEADLDYIKWDFNRPITELYDQRLSNQGEFAHRYVCGLYELLNRLTQAFPHVLFESCASGGNRFDYGMLYFTPQIWTSDNTDVHSRMLIQHGTSYFYPASTMGAHVGSNPNHQLLRTNDIENRFNIAAFGAFGYELNLLTLTPFEEKIIKKQIEFYKEYRLVIQFGEFSRLASPYESNHCVWQVSDEACSLIYYGHILSSPNPTFETLKIKGLDEEQLYLVTNRKQFLNIEVFGDLINHILPVKIKTSGMVGLVHKTVSEHYLYELESMEQRAYGDELMHAGVVLNQLFVGTGHHEQMRLMSDFGSRIYLIKKEQ